MIRKYFLLFALFFLFFNYVPFTYAADFKSDYVVEYFPKEINTSLKTSVKFSIKLTNLKSDLYVKKFSVIFPQEFKITDLEAYDDLGKIQPLVNESSNKTTVELEFTNPRTGRDSDNNFTLNFNQSGLFQSNGSIWEVILPTMQDKEQSSYKAIVNLPSETEKQISISKPSPSSVEGKKIIWMNPATKTIYAVFGTTQQYDTELTYNLRNPKMTPVYTDIAFPPDTLYQKIYIRNIEPRPDSVYLDEDGNYMGRYFLKPIEKKTVIFSGNIEIFAKPREDQIVLTRKRIEIQKKYLLNESKFWRLTDLSAFGELKSPSDIYYYTVNSLKYDYGKSSSDKERLGASKALLFPSKAVCVEFSDLFIALAREKGLYSREVQGYGFSNDSRLRPISLSSDILHSWPEYYDKRAEIWLSVDPTWENTSGIDYFSSLDLNHIVFAIHGKKADYPLAAGMYKIEDTKDIIIKPSSSKISERINLAVSKINFSETIYDNRSYKIKLNIENKGNVFVNNINYKILADKLNLQGNIGLVDSLAPYESRSLEVNYSALNKNLKTTTSLTISLNDKEVYTSTIKIVPYYYEIALFSGFLLLGFFIVILVIFILSNNRAKK